MALIAGDGGLQHAVQAVLDELVANGDEVGLQATVIKDGAVVADAQSGVADPASGEPVSAGTLFSAGSTAKGVLSSLVHPFVAAGRLDYDLRLAEVWPEFAQHGKGERDRATSGSASSFQVLLLACWKASHSAAAVDVSGGGPNDGRRPT